MVPPDAATRDAIDSPDPFPGTYLTSRQQVLLGPSWLTSLPQPCALLSVSFRRDGADARALAAGSGQLTLRVSSAAVAPARAAERFESNHGSAVTTVFAGTVAFPASPALAHRDEPDWGPQHSFTLAFSAPFPYAGGTLCLDIAGSPLQSTRWPVDYHSDLLVGRVQRRGAACGPVRTVTSKTARVSDWALRPGSSIRLSVLGERSGAAVLLLGTSFLTPPLPLDFVGATGCELHVQPLLSLSTASSVRGARGPNHPGVGEIVVHMPGEPGIVGSDIVAQWLNVASTTYGLRLSTSDALQLTFGGGLGSYDATTVTSERADGLPVPLAGRVAAGHAPVVRIAYR
ncbi:MAG: hypothetical protein R3F56_19345 [Planctomycetota bacterium]